MKRDFLQLAPRPYVSDRSSGYFIRLIEIIGRHHEPTKTQLESLESSYRSTGEFLTGCDEFDGLLNQIHPHGSRELGTMTRPREDSRDGFDIDLIARLDRNALRRYEGPSGPSRLQEYLFLALQRYAKMHGLGIKRWERCVTLEYANGMTADIAPVIDDPLLAVPFGDTHGRVPDRELRAYHATNPLGYAAYFNNVALISPIFSFQESVVKGLDSAKRADISPLSDADQVFDRMLCRLVQLIKLHRNVAFGVSKDKLDIAPSSIFISTLVAEAYAQESLKVHSSPLSLLLDVVETMPNYFSSGHGRYRDEWHLPNPSAPKDYLASSMNSPERQQAFLMWHQKLLTDLQQLLDAIESHSGSDEILSMVESVFGKRATNGIRQDQLEQQQRRRAAKTAAIIAPNTAPRMVTSRTHTFFGG